MTIKIITRLNAILKIAISNFLFANLCGIDLFNHKTQIW